MDTCVPRDNPCLSKNEKVRELFCIESLVEIPRSYAEKLGQPGIVEYSLFKNYLANIYDINVLEQLTFSNRVLKLGLPSTDVIPGVDTCIKVDSETYDCYVAFGYKDFSEVEQKITGYYIVFKYKQYAHASIIRAPFQSVCWAVGAMSSQVEPKAGFTHSYKCGVHTQEDCDLVYENTRLLIGNDYICEKELTDKGCMLHCQL